MKIVLPIVLFERRESAFAESCTGVPVYQRSPDRDHRYGDAGTLRGPDSAALRSGLRQNDH